MLSSTKRDSLAGSGGRFICSAMRIAAMTLAVLTATLPLPGLAGGGPHNLALVVNSNDASSLTVANHYVALRSIPPNNVIYVDWKQTADQTGGQAFRERLLKPVLAEIENRGLEDQIDYVAFSSGFPYRVTFNSEFPISSMPRQNRPMMSLTGATYLYEQVIAKSKNAFGLNSNYYCSPPTGYVTTTRAFESEQEWAPGGKPVKDGGRRYLLCTALGVTSGRGNSVNEIVSYLKRAKMADGTRPSGTVYYMKNNNVRSQTRHGRFPAAVAELRKAGVRAQEIDGVIPRGKADVAGITTGSAIVKLVGSNIRLVPGALVDNLTSSGGVMTLSPGKKQQTPISDYMRMGAAGASGTVVEPLAIQAKFPLPSLHLHYARGCTLAEAFYHSVQAPFQLLIVGDPLCQPWARIPEVTVDGVRDGQFVDGIVTISPSTEGAGARKIRRFELCVDGAVEQVCKNGESLTLDTTKIADGTHELRVAAIVDSASAEQGQWIGTIRVKNGSDAVQLSLVGDDSVQLGDTLTLAIRATSDAPVSVQFNSRTVAKTSGRNRRVTLDTKTLGSGPIELYAIQSGGLGFRSAPLKLEIR